MNKILKTQAASSEQNKEEKQNNLNNLRIKYFKLRTKLNELKIEEQSLQNIEKESTNNNFFNEYDFKKGKKYINY
jgi:hypothetical protein